MTGIWMGNPLRKRILGSSMTGGHGAVPYFNAFMIPFMKDKPRDSFPGVPPMPNDIKALAERNKREELEKLEDADLAGKKTGIVFTPGVKLPDEPGMTPADKVGGEKPGEDTKGDKPATTTDQPPVQRRPPVQPPTVKPDPPSDRPEGTRRKGKKGDG
ncbi:MAG: hypothetical protein IPP63_07260 [Chloracidobacterium sp.]|nr:hypothetical protein [Chloracidobacterium sp.]